MVECAFSVRQDDNKYIYIYYYLNIWLGYTLQIWYGWLELRICFFCKVQYMLPLKTEAARNLEISNAIPNSPASLIWQEKIFNKNVEVCTYQ